MAWDSTLVDDVENHDDLLLLLLCLPFQPLLDVDIGSSQSPQSFATAGLLLLVRGVG